jgi:transcriptional regulator
MMKQTDHHKAFEKNSNVLCVFTGHHCYVSATLYSDPHQASTWNYMAVHVRGQLQFLDDAGLITVLKKTSAHFENYNAQSSTTFDNLPKEYTDRLMKAIIAFEVQVEEIENVFKLSQNRDEKSYQNIISNLKQGNPDEKTIAEEMLKRQNQLFSK